MSEPRCPMGHEMELYRIASGGWRYGCRACATSFKSIKRQAYGWISPIKSTKELARKAAMERAAREPITAAEISSIWYVWPCWIEIKGETPQPIILDKDSAGYFSRGQISSERYSLETYGINWRCWVGAYPTQEEREKAAWQE